MFPFYSHPPDSPAGDGHFFSATLLPGRQDAEITDDSIDTVIQTETRIIAEVYEKYAAYVYTPTLSPPDRSADDWRYAANGGASGAPSFADGIDRCVECGGSLRKHSSEKAHIYGFYYRRDATHVVRRCARTACRARHWYNYTISAGKTQYFPRSKRRSVLFPNSSVAFDVTFMRYVQQLHFYGCVSLAAVARAQSAVFSAPPPSTRRFQKLIARAFFLLRVVVGFPDIGYYLRDYNRQRDTRGGSLRLHRVSRTVCLPAEDHK